MLLRPDPLLAAIEALLLIFLARFFAVAACGSHTPYLLICLQLARGRPCAHLQHSSEVIRSGPEAPIHTMVFQSWQDFCLMHRGESLRPASVQYTKGKWIHEIQRPQAKKILALSDLVFS